LKTTMPLDMELYRRAGEAGKERGGIETVEEQIAMFTALSMEEQITLLDTTLEYLENAEGESMTEKMVVSYLSGDGAELMDVMTSYMDTADPVHRKFEALLFNERNDRMSARIDAMLRDADQVTFIAVGAAHFFGEDGILAQLRTVGHDVRRLSAADVERVENAVMAVN
ncbi:MAG: TraB/GumN family protein, partial [Gemmatimonadetes bacterium]|nr:TraB/GumN family protein [Gemmatimonadota bacterium]